MRKLFALSAFLVAAGAQAQLHYHVTDLGTIPQSNSANPLGINNLAQITGSSGNHAFEFQNGTILDLGTLGGAASSGAGINAAGQITGYAETAANQDHAFLYSNGSMHDLGTLGGNFSAGYALNASGQVVGDAYLPGSIDHAFLYSNGEMNDLGTLGGTQSQAYGINASGQIVGISFTTGNAATHAFLYSGGIMQDLGAALGGNDSNATGINDSGQIVGYTYLANTFGGQSIHAFSYSNGVMVDLGTVGGDTSQASGINSSGQIVGWSYNTNDILQVGFVYSDGEMYNLNTLLDSSSSGDFVEVANSINDNGLIVAVGSGQASHGSISHALLLTPIAPGVIVPTSYSLVVGFLGGGSLYSVQFNDSYYLTVQRGITAGFGEAPIQVQLSATSPTMSPNNFQFTLTGHTNTPGLSESILLYNFNTSAYETVSTTAASFNSDTTVTVTGAGTLSRYVNQSTGEVRARVAYNQTGPTSSYNWTARLGVANWVIQ